jgi:hypothetical protein
VWIESIKKECNKAIYVRVQRHITLRMAKAYCTISHEALCILTGITPINIKAEEIVTMYSTTGRKNHEQQIDKAENPRNWLHPADIISVNDTKDVGKDQLWHIFTGGSKSEQGVGFGFAVILGKFLTEQFKFKLHDRCLNNQAEQLAIVKAFEVIESQQENQNGNRTAVIYTDSKITLDSITSAKNQTTS